MQQQQQHHQQQSQVLSFLPAFSVIKKSSRNPVWSSTAYLQHHEAGDVEHPEGHEAQRRECEGGQGEAADDRDLH